MSSIFTRSSGLIGRYLGAYVSSLCVGLTVVGIPIVGPGAPLFILLLAVPFTQNNPDYTSFWLYYLPIPAFLAILAADRLRLVDRQIRHSNRAFLARIGCAVGGLTTVALIVYGAFSQPVPGVSGSEVFGFLLIVFAGVPAGMVMGAVMARPEAQRRSEESAARP